MVKFKTVTGDTDIQIVVDLSVEIWTEHYVPIIGNSQVAYMLNKFLSPEAIQCQRIDGICYKLILLGSETIGYFAFKRDKIDIFLSKLYVSKKLRGQGIGRECIDWLFNVYSPNVISLSVNKYNLKTVRFYQSNGFKIIDDVVVDIGGGFVMDDYVMEARR
ncbi:MAG: GNAT family N-acetyltransferase [Richelia sp.]|nr:GNAT family N-acetyltransferase [Richelia sp.]CDN10647.1 hypothetical protein RintRC_2948 [Richelia intracellularis]